jgi:hypothetical protein
VIEKHLRGPSLGHQRKEDVMRELILKMSISIDGFVGGPHGGIRWVFDRDQEATSEPSRPCVSIGVQLLDADTPDYRVKTLHAETLGSRVRF